MSHRGGSGGGGGGRARQDEGGGSGGEVRGGGRGGRERGRGEGGGAAGAAGEEEEGEARWCHSPLTLQAALPCFSLASRWCHSPLTCFACSLPSSTFATANSSSILCILYSHCPGAYAPFGEFWNPPHPLSLCLPPCLSPRLAVSPSLTAAFSSRSASMVRRSCDSSSL